MIKYPKIKRIGHRSTEGVLNDGTELLITEKLDGNNFRWTFDEEYSKLVFGSRNVEFRKEGGEPMFPEHSGFGSQFRDAAEYVIDALSPMELNEDVRIIVGAIEYYLKDIIFFGENMVKHTLDYPFGKMPQWLCFDIYHAEDERWIQNHEVEEICRAIGLAKVPTVSVKKPVAEFKEMFDAENPDSVIPDKSNFREGKPEGVVIKNRDNGLRAKILTEEFKERHRSGKDKASHGEEHLPGDNTIEFVNMYATDARIRKHIKKLTVDEDKELEMALMEELPMRVVEDIFEEEYEEIVRINKTVDLKTFRSKVAKKCVSLLRAEIRSQSV